MRIRGSQSDDASPIPDQDDSFTAMNGSRRKSHREIVILLTIYMYAYFVKIVIFAAQAAPEHFRSLLLFDPTVGDPVTASVAARASSRQPSPGKTT